MELSGVLQGSFIILSEWFFFSSLCFTILYAHFIVNTLEEVCLWINYYDSVNRCLNISLVKNAYFYCLRSLHFARYIPILLLLKCACLSSSFVPVTTTYIMYYYSRDIKRNYSSVNVTNKRLLEERRGQYEVPEALSSEFANLYFTNSAIPMDTKCQNVPSASEMITNGDGFSILTVI